MKRRWIALAAVVVVVAAAAVLALCLPGGGNTLWEEATEDYLILYCYDGEKLWKGQLNEGEKVRALLEELAEARTEPVEDWSPEKLEYPLYSISVSTGAGLSRSVGGIWSNGYLLFHDGTAYRFSFDFAEAQSDHRWEDVSTRWDIWRMENLRLLAETEAGWDPDVMAPSSFAPSGNGDIAMEAAEVSGGQLTVTLTNHSEEDWSYGESFDIDVLLGGQWYDVPQLPGRGLIVKYISWGLPAGGTQKMTYSLETFGELPAGTYRVTAEGLSAKFVVE